MTAASTGDFEESPVQWQCAKCTKPHITRRGDSSCRGHKRNGDPCTSDPMQGGFVCRMHGGSTPVVKAKAAERVQRHFVEGKVGFLLKQQGIDVPNQHPLDGLLEVVRHSGGMMRVLQGLVGELQLDVDKGLEMWGVDDGGNPVFKMPKNIYGRNHVGDGAAHILVEMYHQWMMTYARACKLALDANIDERMVRNATLVSDHVYEAFQHAVKAADLDAVQAKKFSEALASSLRAMSAGTLPGKVVS